MDDIPVLLKAIILVINLVSVWYFVLANPLKISNQSSTKLTFTIRPIVFLGIGIFCSQFVIFFLFHALMTTSITQLICDHSPHNISILNVNARAGKNTLSLACKLTENDWLGREKSRKLISDLLEAKLETQIQTNSQTQPSYRYKVLLLTPTDTIPFTRKTYGDYKIEELGSFVLSINNFLSNSKGDNLVVKQDDSLLSYIDFATAILSGIFALLVASAGSFINFNFDKEANIIKISHYRWLGIFGKKVFQYSSNKIINVKNERTDTSDSDYFHQVKLILAFGNNQPLTPKYTSGYINGDYIIRMIKDFLKPK